MYPELLLNKSPLSIEGPEEFQYLTESLCLAVIPELFLSAKSVKVPYSEKSDGKKFYNPEIKGLSITGQLTDNTTRNRLNDTSFDLSVICKGRDFMAMKTEHPLHKKYSLLEPIACIEQNQFCEVINYGT